MDKIKWLQRFSRIAALLILASMIFMIGVYVIEFKGEEKETEFSIIDDYGRKVMLQNPPQRIISLAPSITEILFAVGLGDRIVGVDEYSNYPEEARSKKKIGSYLTPNIEMIVSLRPDLVLVSDITSRDDVAVLEEKGLTVAVLAPKTVDDIIKDIRLIGVIGNNMKEADNLAGALEKRMKALTSKIDENTTYKPRVYIEYYPYWTYGPGSFGNDLISMAGGTNIGAKTLNAYVEITNEFLVASNPEIIIFTVGPHSSTTMEEIKSRPGWSSTDAVKHEKIYTIDDDIISRPGPRIVDALEYLARLIHPEIFPQICNERTSINIV